MPLVAKALFERARRMLQDNTSVRWPLSELCEWLNDAMREVVLQKPNASGRNFVMALQLGTYQALPATYTQLLRVVRNLKVVDDSPRQGGRAIRVVARNVLDTQHPDWHDADVTTQTKVVKHFIFDETDPLTFYVYPGNDGTGFVEVVAAKAPDPVEATGAVEDLESYNVELDIQEIYGNAILDYMLYRAYGKDAEYAGNGARSAAHYTQFANSLGMKLNGEVIVSPNTKPRVETA